MGDDSGVKKCVLTNEVWNLKTLYHAVVLNVDVQKKGSLDSDIFF